jgi:DNA-binding CsgD family transcriptional regulator
MVTKYQTGATVNELAQEFRIHRSTASSLLARNGIARRGRPLSHAQIDEALELYATGKSLASVGEELGCDPSTI